MTNSKKPFSAKNFIVKYEAILILVVLIVVSAILSDKFLTVGNILNILRQNTALLVISFGMLFVILTGGIDLAVGSIAAASAMFMSIAITNIMPDSPGSIVIGLLVGIGIGAGFGAATGALVSYLKLAPFIVTVAMTTIASGVAYLSTNGQPVRWGSGTISADFFVSMGKDSAGLPWLVWIEIGVFIVMFLVLKYTVFGRMLIATGSNEEAVRLSGINASRYKFFAYVISGALAALGGIVMACRTGQGAPTIGSGYELDAIAACVIGGASLNGGKGGIVNTVIGVMVLALITNIMNLLSVAAYPQEIIKGLIIIAAVLVNTLGESAKKE